MGLPFATSYPQWYSDVVVGVFWCLRSLPLLIACVVTVVAFKRCINYARSIVWVACAVLLWVSGIGFFMWFTEHRLNRLTWWF